MAKVGRSLAELKASDFDLAVQEENKDILKMTPRRNGSPFWRTFGRWCTSGTPEKPTKEAAGASLGRRQLAELYGGQLDGPESSTCPVQLESCRNQLSEEVTTHQSLSATYTKQLEDTHRCSGGCSQGDRALARSLAVKQGVPHIPRHSCIAF